LEKKKLRSFILALSSLSNEIYSSEIMLRRNSV
jgi:hypothetical protein